MPSPIGHALGGIAAGATVSGRAGWGSLAIFALAGALPDVDFLLPIPHRGPTHSIASAVVVFLVAWPVLAWRRPADWRGRPAIRLALAIGAAWGSHTLLDWLGADSSAPRGVMALWPLTTMYYISGVDVFNTVNRRYWLPGFWRSNTVAVLREIAILGPVAAGIGWFAEVNRRTARQSISARRR
jgi:inner membrane protein